MNVPPRVAVTGAGGCLGRALMDALGSAGVNAIACSRPEYDLDDAGAAAAVIERSHPDIVIHTAAWTDVDGCALDPELADRRNARACAELADVCVRADTRLILISTNEVFDGRRTDGPGYDEADRPRPVNPYGASKLAGENSARLAYVRRGRSTGLLIVRTAWLFGPPGRDFPAKILAAADALAGDEPLGVVADEVGSPTYSRDLAAALVRIVIDHAPAGTYHLVNAGRASRLDVARRVLEHCRPGRLITPISRADLVRPSLPPAWAVLRTTALPKSLRLRPWQEAIDAYLPSICPA